MPLESTGVRAIALAVVRRGDAILLYEATLGDPSLLDRPRMQIQEDNGTWHTIVWKSVADFRNSAERLYPDGVLELLVEHE